MEKDDDVARDDIISHATDELRAYASALDDLGSELQSIRDFLDDGKLNPVDWGVHKNIIKATKYPQLAGEPGQRNLDDAGAPAELVAFREAYEQAHDALNHRLSLIQSALEDDSHTYRLIADRYDETEEDNIDDADVDVAHGEAVIPRPD